MQGAVGRSPHGRLVGRGEPGTASPGGEEIPQEFAEAMVGSCQSSLLQKQSEVLDKGFKVVTDSGSKGL